MLSFGCRDRDVVMCGERSNLSSLSRVDVAMKMRLAIALSLSVFGACSPNSDAPAAVLIVQPAQDQPAAAGNGVIVVVQSTGGRWLEVVVHAGLLVGGQKSACLPAPKGGPLSAQLTDFLVYPESSEAVVTVRLLPDAPRSPVDSGQGGEAGGGSSDVQRPCRVDAEPLREVIRPIQRLNAGAQPAATGGTPNAAGGTDTGGSATSGGSGGASGASGEPNATGGVQ